MGKLRQEPYEIGMSEQEWLHREVITIMEREDEDSRTASLHHDLFGLIEITPQIEWSTGVEWAGRHDATLVLQLNVIQRVMYVYNDGISAFDQVYRLWERRCELHQP